MATIILLLPQQGGHMNNYDLKIFTDNIASEAVHTVYELAANPSFEGSRIRIMPDVNPGIGCVVGFTATVGSGIIPNVIGVDIGCGMLCVTLGTKPIDFAQLDSFIKSTIPAGFAVGSYSPQAEKLIDQLRCKKDLRNLDKLLCSLGSLGGGNHFIEVDVDDHGCYHLVIHTGSRNLGLQVAKHYQRLAVKQCKDAPLAMREELIARCKKEGRVADIPDELKQLTKQFAYRTKVPADMCFLTDEAQQDYLHDVQICTRFAALNRKTIANKIAQYLGATGYNSFETIHNYIGADGIVRKGAISARAGEKVLIPLNMRDGCLVAVGKGNPDWNYSAPHGAGRLLSRAEAKAMLTVEEFNDQMQGIYTTTANAATIDESPMAYKDTDEIKALIAPTVDIQGLIRPVYNFKYSSLQEEENQ